MYASYTYIYIVQSLNNIEILYFTSKYFSMRIYFSINYKALITAHKISYNYPISFKIQSIFKFPPFPSLFESGSNQECHTVFCCCVS